jgi:ABC-type Fe3+-hydroxamate transport system substrate-binding protein
MKYIFLTILFLVVVLSGCVLNPAESGVEEEIEKTTVETTDELGQPIVIEEGEELEDVVEGIDEDLDEFDVDELYGEVEEEDFGY